MQTITSWEDFVRSFTPEQFKGIGVEKIVFALNDDADELQQTFIDLIEKFWLDTATGDQLDLLGDVIGLDRNGATDDNYRTYLQVKIQVDKSPGVRASLITAIRLLYSADYVEIRYQYPAKIEIYNDGLFGIYIGYPVEIDDGSFLVTEAGDSFCFRGPDEIDESLVENLLPAGVGLILLYLLETSSDDLLIYESLSGETGYILVT